jgi:16S rRNA (guanine(966)-N(2))-methyltransferase RsmD
MRIIAGKFRSRPLKSLKGLALRPTSDMLRETLFNILGPRVEGSRFLDLFAGTGAVGIEAISRGATFATFVEDHHAAVRLIRQNLASLEIHMEARIIASSVNPALEKLQKERAAVFDFIFLDPPYSNEKDYQATFRSLENSSLIAESTIVIAEHHKSFEIPAALGQFEQVRVLRQGDAALSFYRPSSSENSSK